MTLEPGNPVKNPGILLADWLKGHRGAFPNDGDFARAAGCSAGRLSQILKGIGGRVRPELAIAIHRETYGAVPGNLWRPDLWHRAEDVPVNPRGHQ